MGKLSDIVTAIRTEPQTNNPDPVTPLSRAVKESRTNFFDQGVNNAVGYNTDIGESRFDENYHPNIYRDLEDYRSKEQHWGLKTAALFGRTANKVVTELAKIPGYLGGGIGAAIGEATEALGGRESNGMKDFVDNAWIRALNDYEGYVNKELMPVYVKESVRNGNLWDNISSIDFWATEGADGLGFMLSMLIPGMAVGKLGAGAKLMGKLGRATKSPKLLTKIDEASNLLGLESGAAAIDTGLATAVNTIYEAGAEANSVMQSIERKPDESDREFELRKATAARNVFISNLGILLLPNAILNRNLLGKLQPRKGLGNFVYNEGKITNQLKNKPLGQRIGEYGKIIGSNTLREGFFEEGMQSTMEEYYKEHDYFDADKVYEGYKEMLGTVEGQKAIFLGSLFGSAMNIVAKPFQDKANSKRNDNLADAINKGIDLYEASLNGIYKKDSQGNVSVDEKGNPVIDLGKLKDLAVSSSDIQKRNEMLEEARAKGDNQTADYLQHQLDTELALSFIKAGDEGLELLRQKLEDSKDQLEGTGNMADVDTRISEIVENARELMNDVNFYTRYGTVIVSNRENQIYEPEFKNKITNAYIKNTSDLRYVNKLIKDTENDISRFEGFSQELLEEDDNSVLKALKGSLRGLQQFKSKLQKDNRDLRSAKYQKEQFKEFVKQKENIEKEEETFAEEINEDQQEQEREDQQELLRQQNAVDDTREETVQEAKKTVNEMHDKLNSVFEKIKEDDANDVNKVEGVMPGSKDPELLNKTGSASIDAQGNVTFPFGVDSKELTDLFPELNDAASARIVKMTDKNGDEIFKIIATDLDGNPMNIPDIKPYKTGKTDEAKVEEVSKNTSPVDDNITNLDTVYDNQVNKETAADMEKADVETATGEKADKYSTTKNKKIVERKHVKMINSTKDTMIMSENFKDFREAQRDKTGDKVTFDIGGAGTNKLAEKAILTYNKFIYDNIPLTKDDREDLIRYLPIRIRFADNVYSQLYFESDVNNNTELSPAERKLRESIVDNIMNNKTSLENMSSKIAFQFPGYIQNETLQDGKPVQNSVLDLQGINDLEDIDLMYTNRNGRIMDLDKKPSTTFVNYFVKASDKGSIYMASKMANGRAIPLKLNIRRINEKEADLIIAVTEKLLNPNNNIQYTDYISDYEDIYDMVNKDFKDEVKAMGLTMKNLRITDLMLHFIFQGSTKKNWYNIKGQFLTYGSEKVNYESFMENKQDIHTWLVNSKNRNIRVSKLQEQAYKKHMLESKVISTDIKTDGPIFSNNTDIYIDTVIDVKQSEVLPQQQQEQPKPESKKRSLGNKKKKVNPYKKFMNKANKNDKGEDSNTIC